MFKVMLVDDEETVLDDLKTVIEWEEYGYKIESCVTNPKKALVLDSEGEFDVIFVDIHMPQINGIELIESLREQKSKAIIVLLTAFEQFDYAKKAIALGVFEYMVKPVDPYELETVLNNISQKLNASDGEIKINSMPPVIKEIISHIEENFSEELRLSYYSNKHFLNLSYLSHLFKVNTGLSFNTYLVNYRINTAKNLLEETDVSVGEISQRVGYGDFSHFSKIFKKYTGKSPNEYRKSVRNKG